MLDDVLYMHTLSYRKPKVSCNMHTVLQFRKISLSFVLFACRNEPVWLLALMAGLVCIGLTVYLVVGYGRQQQKLKTHTAVPDIRTASSFQTGAASRSDPTAHILETSGFPTTNNENNARDILEEDAPDNGSNSRTHVVNMSLSRSVSRTPPVETLANRSQSRIPALDMPAHMEEPPSHEGATPLGTPPPSYEEAIFGRFHDGNAST